MQVFELEEQQTLSIGADTEVEIIEIRDEFVRIAIRSQSISPYYWEEEISCEQEQVLSESLSL